MDMPPMDPCPVGKAGRHALSFVIPPDTDGDLTLACNHCGAIRRVPVDGDLYLSRLDDLEAEDIKAWTDAR